MLERTQHKHGNYVTISSAHLTANMHLFVVCNQYSTLHLRLTIVSSFHQGMERAGNRQIVSRTVRALESTSDPIRKRKLNLSHNRQLLHAFARVHKNMKRARILENRKT